MRLTIDKCPLHYDLIGPESARTVCFAHALRLASLIPGGRFTAFSGARHLPNVEHPDRFNRIPMEWLRRT